MGKHLSVFGLARRLLPEEVGRYLVSVKTLIVFLGEEYGSNANVIRYLAQRTLYISTTFEGYGWVHPLKNLGLRVWNWCRKIQLEYYGFSVNLKSIS